MSFKFLVGQAVEYTPIGEKKPGLFKVVRQMPMEDQAIDVYYRIKSETENYERNVAECHLSPMRAPTARLPAFPLAITTVPTATEKFHRELIVSIAAFCAAPRLVWDRCGAKYSSPLPGRDLIGRGQSPVPGFGERCWSLSGLPSHSLEFAGGVFLTVMLGHAFAYWALISTHFSIPGSVSGLMASTGHSGSHTPQSIHSSGWMTSMFSPS